MSDQPQKKTVLVVDDSKSIRTILNILLRKMGVDSIFAEDGIEALEILKTRTPDLILLDLMMPRMDGLTLIDEIKTHEHLLAIPRIVISSRQDDPTLKGSRDRGVVAYVVKPISMELLRPLIREALESGSFSDAIGLG